MKRPSGSRRVRKSCPLTAPKTRSAAKPWKPSGMQNFCRVPAETIGTCTIFCPAAKILPTKRARSGVQKRTPKWRPLIQSQFDLLVSGRLGPRFGVRFWTPKRAPFCRQNFCRRAKNSASSDCFRRHATEVLHTAGFPWFCSAAGTCSLHPANVYVHTCS